MRTPSGKKVHYDSGPNMTPLVDIVMCILIFLMMVGSFAETGHFLAAKMPLAASDVPPTRAVVPDEPVEINVEANPGDGPAWRATSGRIGTSDAEALSAALGGLRRGMNDAG